MAENTLVCVYVCMYCIYIYTYTYIQLHTYIYIYIETHIPQLPQKEEIFFQVEVASNDLIEKATIYPDIERWIELNGKLAYKEKDKHEEKSKS